MSLGNQETYNTNSIEEYPSKSQCYQKKNHTICSQYSDLRNMNTMDPVLLYNTEHINKQK